MADTVTLTCKECCGEFDGLAGYDDLCPDCEEKARAENMAEDEAMEKYFERKYGHGD